MICDTEGMDDTRAAEVTAESVAVLRQAGTRFAYLFGSRAAGSHRPESDIDIAAYFGDHPPNSFEILLPPGVDLLVLDHAPLELAGRVATGGKLLFDDDPVVRVRWEVLVHEYIEVDDAIVVGRLGALSDLEEFVGEVAAYVTKE